MIQPVKKKKNEVIISKENTKHVIEFACYDCANELRIECTDGRVFYPYGDMAKFENVDLNKAFGIRR